MRGRAGALIHRRTHQCTLLILDVGGAFGFIINLIIQVILRVPVSRQVEL